jgi:SPP1 gp7 family putative phage head morphogenesis protein
MRENVELIKSIPLKAAERVHELVTENLMQSARADEISQKIMESEKVSKVVATRIARTEIARASSTLLQSRALSIGSTGYIWKTSKDLLVRKSHKIMEGKFIKWNDPPKLSDGTITHAGQIYNCRCWPDVQIPEGNYS